MAMKKKFLPLLVVFLVASSGASVLAGDYAIANSHYAPQIGLDSFNYSVQKRLESIRLGSISLNYASAPLIRSDGALAAPASRSSSVRGASGGRQIDCVYNNGLTVWGDLYQTWASQSSGDGGHGYRYRATSPAVGIDWTSGAFTGGIATSYNWGKLKDKDGGGDLTARTWGLEAYGQYNAQKYYISADLGYGYTHYKSPSFHSNSLNLGAEFGLKFNFNDILITPHAGMRVFHDRRGAVERGNLPSSGRDSYYVWEIPMGVAVGYVFRAGGVMIMPQVKAGWTPELARRRSGFAGFSAPRRARNGFILGAGLEARITQSLSGHLDYTANLRNNAYEHHWNLGVGFSF
jgi:hypothetical protein